jgi:hypothetical protein
MLHRAPPSFNIFKQHVRRIKMYLLTSNSSGTSLNVAVSIITRSNGFTRQFTASCLFPKLLPNKARPPFITFYGLIIWNGSKIPQSKLISNILTVCAVPDRDFSALVQNTTYWNDVRGKSVDNESMMHSLNLKLITSQPADIRRRKL